MTDPLAKLTNESSISIVMAGVYGSLDSTESELRVPLLDETSSGDSTQESSYDHPSHYGGKDNPYEVIKVIRAWNLGFALGNALKYIGRAGKKDPAKHLEDLKKARWYIDDEIKALEGGYGAP